MVISHFKTCKAVCLRSCVLGIKKLTMAKNSYLCAFLKLNITRKLTYKGLTVERKG
jgi:hypothetical protein